MKTNILLITIVILAIISSDLQSQDWPQFRGSGRDSKVTGFKAPATWPAGLATQWKVTVGTGDASPVLEGKKIFLHTRQGTDEVILSLDAVTGKTVWLDEAVNSDFATIVDCGSVIIGFPSTGNLIVLKPDTKAYSEIAKYKVSETPVYAFPVVAGNMVYVKDAESLILYKIN